MDKKYSVEIVIPIYNEEVELQKNIEKLYLYLKNNLSSYNWHITIADNASTDRSLYIAQQLAKNYPHVSAFHLNQKGRGRAVKKVWLKSKADILAYMDVDLSTKLSELRPLLASITQGYNIAIGSRLLPTSSVAQRPLKREILSRGYNILIKLSFGTKFSDAQCGFKAVTKMVAAHLMPHIKDNAWFFDSEFLIIAEKVGYTIYEQPVVWIDNPGSTVRVLKTVTGDLAGLWRLYWSRPWTRLKINE